MSFKNSKRYIEIIDKIDFENKHDVEFVEDNEKCYPKELLYSIRMTEILDTVFPESSELLHVAARGQHIRRWTIARDEYPEGRTGYHQWRKALSDIHVELTRKLMLESNYTLEETNEVEEILRKKDLKQNPDSQLLQDVVSIVFLKYYALDFAAKHSDKNITDILIKVLRKMSDKAINKAKEVSPQAIIDALHQIQLK